ncbi:MAG TPA: carbon starvation protein A [Negativicutes bacterium]|nr:carbon starvation protein A [Negativicutes bacterium]
MNSSLLIVVAVCFFALAYRYYGSFIATKVIMLNDENKTPAYRLNDGREYVPTNKWVLFGHHFAAIAGAGPLVGPVLGAQYGWGPGFVWLMLGAVFAGAVHDFIILFASIRHNGQSLSMIARKEVSPVTGIASSLAIVFIILIALAGLGIVIVNALFKNPWGVYTLFMTIPIAMGVGLYMFKIRPGAIRSGSIVGFLLVLAAVFTGSYIPGSFLAGMFTLTAKQLSIALPLYGFCAAVLPVWLLLAPRDYLSSYMKIGTVAALILGVIIVQPPLHMPATTQFMDGGGPIIPGPWWPYVFITIACGAISGFHALISSGTTCKMIERESQSTMIAYGGMLVEGVVGIVALISACVMFPGDYFAINSLAPAYAKISGAFPVVELKQLSALVGMEVAHRPGGAVSLAVGMASIFSSIGGMSHLMNYWYQFAIMFEALFILTTIDAGTRVARYVLQDVLGTYFYAPLKQTGWWPGTLFCSTLVTIGWGYLLYTGDISTVWPLFGVSNQLLGCIALAVGVTIILKIAPKKSYAWVCLAPLCFLSVTVLAADVMNIMNYWKAGDVLKASISLVIFVLVVITLADSVRKWVELLKTDKPIGMNTDTPALQFGESKATIQS